MNKSIKYSVIGVIVSVVLFFVLGSVSALIPNPFFVRMVESTSLDWIFLISSSVLLGIYTGIHYYKKTVVNACTTTSYAGGIGSFLAFGCPICNKLLIILFGTTALMTYFDPYRSILGFGSIVILLVAIFWRIRN